MNDRVFKPAIQPSPDIALLLQTLYIMMYLTVMVLLLCAVAKSTCEVSVCDNGQEGPAREYLVSKNYPGYSWGVSGDEAVITVHGMNFDVVNGLSGDEGSISFESSWHYGFYLRHANGVMWLNENDGSDLFLLDASFFPRENKFFSGFVSFESVNIPNNFVRNQNYRLKIAPAEDADLYRNDASFTRQCEALPVLSGDGCPNGFLALAADSCYKLGTSDISWSDASAWCRDEGGYLVSVNDQSEQNVVSDYLRNIAHPGEAIWIGLNDREDRDQWSWDNGDSAEYRNWRYGLEPDGNTEHCVVIDGYNNYEWHDLTCSSTYHVYALCEADKDPTSTEATDWLVSFILSIFL